MIAKNWSRVKPALSLKTVAVVHIFPASGQRELPAIIASDNWRDRAYL